jgi:hypothetical protein
MVFHEGYLIHKLSVLTKFCVVYDQNLLLHKNIAVTYIRKFLVEQANIAALDDITQERQYTIQSLSKCISQQVKPFYCQFYLRKSKS